MESRISDQIVVLGSEGQARDQLVLALKELGVLPVWVGRPGQTSPEILHALQSNKFVISLDAIIEQELEAFDEILSQTNVTVIYDEAENTANLSGWDLNRWARHLASKLLNRDTHPNKELNATVAPTTPVDVIPFEIDWTAELPVTMHSEISESIPEMENNWVVEHEPTKFSVDHDEIDKAWSLTDVADVVNEDKVVGLSVEQPSSFEMSLELSNHEHSQTQVSANDFLDIENLAEDDFSLQTSETVLDESVGSKLTDFEFVNYMEDASLLAAKIGETESFNNNTDALAENNSITMNLLPELQAELDGSSALTVAAGIVDTEQQTPAREFDISKFSLLEQTSDEDKDITIASNYTNSGTENTDTESNASCALVLLLSGIGGPGAIREILGKLNAQYDGRVVISHQIATVQLSAFRDQLQKLTQTPVKIPAPDEVLHGQSIYVLPENHIVMLTEHGYQCIQASSMSEYIELVDYDAKIVVLSGADNSLFQSLIQVSAIAGNVFIQNPVDCFEPMLVNQMHCAGAVIYSLENVERWFN